MVSSKDQNENQLVTTIWHLEQRKRWKDAIRLYGELFKQDSEVSQNTMKYLLGLANCYFQLSQKEKEKKGEALYTEVISTLRTVMAYCKNNNLRYPQRLVNGMLVAIIKTVFTSDSKYGALLKQIHHDFEVVEFDKIPQAILAAISTLDTEEGLGKYNAVYTLVKSIVEKGGMAWKHKVVGALARETETDPKFWADLIEDCVGAEQNLREAPVKLRLLEKLRQELISRNH
ncbi:MAG: hypothetical protein ABIG20_03950 [archaeon]